MVGSCWAAAGGPPPHMEATRLAKGLASSSPPSPSSSSSGSGVSASMLASVAAAAAAFCSARSLLEADENLKGRSHENDLAVDDLHGQF